MYLVFISMPGESCRRRLGSFCHSFYQRVDLNLKALIHEPMQSSGAVSKSKWLSWAPVPNKPTVSVDVKQHSTKQ